MKTIKLGKYSISKDTQYDPKNYKKTRMTDAIYGNEDQNIKKIKTVTIETPKMKRTKTVNYSPINYYGKQTKTKTVTKVKK